MASKSSQRENNKVIAGIDLSITSPGVTVINGDKILYMFVTTKQKYKYESDSLKHYSIEKKSGIELYDSVSNAIIDFLTENNCKIAGIEGYSYGSFGFHYQIAENCGLLKYKLIKHGIEYRQFAPTEIKKFATGKGNAKKQDLEQQFLKDETINFRQLLKQTAKQYNPSSDIIDSYYIAKLLEERLKNEHDKNSCTV